jgi:hypothetical protein
MNSLLFFQTHEDREKRWCYSVFDQRGGGVLEKEMLLGFGVKDDKRK